MKRFFNLFFTIFAIIIIMMICSSQNSIYFEEFFSVSNTMYNDYSEEYANIDTSNFFRDSTLFIGIQINHKLEIIDKDEKRYNNKDYFPKFVIYGGAPQYTYYELPADRCYYVFDEFSKSIDCKVYTQLHKYNNPYQLLTATFNGSTDNIKVFYAIVDPEKGMSLML